MVSSDTCGTVDARSLSSAILFYQACIIIPFGYGGLFLNPEKLMKSAGSPIVGSGEIRRVNPETKKVGDDRRVVTANDTKIYRITGLWVGTSGVVSAYLGMYGNDEVKL
jgi:hypothetical protein